METQNMFVHFLVFALKINDTRLLYPIMAPIQGLTPARIGPRAGFTGLVVIPDPSGRV